MSKRILQKRKNSSESPLKRKKPAHVDYFEKTLKESGIYLNTSPESCLAQYDIIVVTRNLKKILQKHSDFPQNLTEFFDNFVKRCQDVEVLKYYLFPNIVRKTAEDQAIQCKNDSIVKILLTVPLLQNKLINYIFERAIDLAADSKCGPFIKMILRSLYTLDNIVDSDNIADNIISLLDVAYEEEVRREIITAIPDIIGDQAHDKIVTELSKILKQKDDHELIPATLDCLSYLCLSENQFLELQSATLNILKKTSKCSYFPNFVNFLMIPGKLTESAYMTSVQGLRNALSWPAASIVTPQDIASSQILTALALRNSMVSSKIIANAWMKFISNCKVSTDREPFDFIIILILFSVSEDKQKQLEPILRKQIKLNIFKEDILDKAFENYIPIIKEYLKNLISFTNFLLKTPDSLIQSFAAHIYTLMFTHLEDFCQIVVAELLQLGLDCKHSLINILAILNNVAEKNMSVLKHQSTNIFKLLDRKDDMTLYEIRAVMNLVCGLAYSYDNSEIRSDVHIIIRKYLGRSNQNIKFHGILAGIHAVKYLMVPSTDDNVQISLPDDISYSSVDCLPEGNLREAAQIIELINCSTREFPKMIAFFYDEFCKIIKSTSNIDKLFLLWITEAVTSDLEQNFIVNNLENETVGELTLSLLHCLNTESEMEGVIAINIAGLTLQEKEDVNILILSPLFLLVQTLHMKQQGGDLSSIDALLGCPVIMPIIDIDLIRDDLSDSSISSVLDCHVHCVNWFREVLNAFSCVDDQDLRNKLINRVTHIQQMELLITEILVKTNLIYKPPSWACYPSSNNANEKLEKACIKQSTSKRKEQKKLDSTLPESEKTQATQKNIATKTKLGVAQNIQFRPLNINIIELLNEEINKNDSEHTLTVKMVAFLLNQINKALENTLHSKIKKNIYFNKHNTSDIYDPKEAERCAKSVDKKMPKIMEHLKYVTSSLDTKLGFNDLDGQNEEDEDDFLYNDEIFEYVFCLENIFNFLNIYFKWIGFKNQNQSLLESSLKCLAMVDDTTVVSMTDLLTTVAKNLQVYDKYCIQLSTAMSLIELLKTLQEHSCNVSILNVLRDVAKTFLSKQWKTTEGVDEKGVQLNPSIDALGKVFFENIDILELKNNTLLLMTEIDDLKKGRTNLRSYKSINKNNFSVLFRNIGSALHNRIKHELNKKLTNSEHLNLWENVTMLLQCLVDITKILDTRNNIIVCFKKSAPVLQLFVKHGIPILQIELKHKKQQILQICRLLQKSTRFLQSICYHTIHKNDKVLMNKIPSVKQLLETIPYKVKSMLALNECADAFEMGNLKNRDIHGEIIASQEIVENTELEEDCDDHLPEDSDSDDSDSETGFNSASEII